MEKLKSQLHENSGSHKRNFQNLAQFTFGYQNRGSFFQRQTIKTMKSKSILSLITPILFANLSLAFQRNVAFARSSTILHYKEEFVIAQHAQSFKEQESVDIYLEFLHNRYSRMNEGCDHLTSSDGRNYPFKWIIHSENIEHDSNALEVLGLSDLASSKLLHKFHLYPTTQQSKEERLHANRKYVDTLLVAWKHVTTILEGRLFALLSIIRKAIKTISYALNNIISLGGGRRSILLSISVASVFLFSIVRPLSQFGLRDALQQFTRA